MTFTDLCMTAATPSGVLINPLAATYADALAAAGYALSGGRTLAFSRYITSGQTDGWWSKMAGIYPFEGDNLDEVIVALKGADLTQSGVLSGDILANGGISGRILAGFDSGVGLSELPVTGQYGIGIWLLESISTTTAQRLMGTFSGANDLRLYKNLNDRDVQASADGALTKDVDYTAGLWRTKRSSNLVAELSHNSVVLNRYTTDTTPASISANIFVGAAGTVDTASLITDYGFAFIDDGTMTATQEAAHFTALCRLMDDLGRLTRLSGTLPALVGIGQSYGVGQAGPLTTSQPYNVVTKVESGNFGLRAADELFAQTSLLAVASEDPGGVAACVAIGVECPMVAMATQFAGMRHDATGGTDFDGWTVAFSKGGGAYAALKLGTNPYAQSMDAIAAFLRVAPYARKSGAGTIYLANFHGSANYLDSFYYSYLGAWHTDYLASISALNGQATIAMFHLQESYWSKSGYTSQSSGYDILRRNNAEPTKHLLVTPGYFLTHAADGVHPDNAGSRLLGEYYGKAAYRFATTGAWSPLKPDVANIALASNVITIPMLGAVGALALDTTGTYVTSPNGTAYGFEFIDSTPGGSPTITSVAIDGSNVVVTLSAAPTGPGMRIRYAYTGVAGQNAGPTTGPRGCLHDSDTAVGDQSGATLRNWCVHFDHQVPNANWPFSGASAIAAELKLWLRPEELSGSADDPIGTWQDVSGWRNTATQAGADSIKPVLKLAPTGFNTRNALYFDGTNDFLDHTFTQVNTLCGGTTFVVIRGDTSGDLYDTFYGRGGGQAMYANISSDKWGTWTTSAKSTGDSLYGVTRICATSYDRVTNSGGTVKLYTDVTLRFTDTAGGFAAGGPKIGSGAGVRFFKGWIAEILDYDRLLTDLEREVVTDYLDDKYGITVP